MADLSHKFLCFFLFSSYEVGALMVPFFLNSKVTKVQIRCFLLVIFCGDYRVLHMVYTKSEFPLTLYKTSPIWLVLQILKLQGQYRIGKLKIRDVSANATGICPTSLYLLKRSTIISLPLSSQSKNPQPSSQTS